MNIFNQCEDSLLATPLILDLAILAELLTRVQVGTTHSPTFRSTADTLSFWPLRLSQYRLSPPADSPADDVQQPFQPLHSVLSLLSYMLKAPVVKEGTSVVNSLARQRNGLEQFLKGAFNPSLFLLSFFAY